MNRTINTWLRQISKLLRLMRPLIIFSTLIMAVLIGLAVLAYLELTQKVSSHRVDAVIFTVAFAVCALWLAARLFRWIVETVARLWYEAKREVERDQK